MGYRDEVRTVLAKEMMSERIQIHFRKMRKKYEALMVFSSAGDALDMLTDKSASYQIKDSTLLAYIKEYQATRIDACLVFLEAAMFPALDHLFCSKLRPGMNLDDFWSEIQWAFLKTVVSYPVDRRISRVARNLQLDTLNSICKWQRIESMSWQTVKKIKTVFKGHETEIRNGALNPWDLLVDPKPGHDWDHDDAQDALRSLSPLIEKGVLSKDDGYLLVGCHIYGKKLAALAKELGLTREAAKKRKQRAERAIRKHLTPPGDE